LGYSLLTPYTTFIAVDEVFSNAAKQAENVHSQASADELQWLLYPLVLLLEWLSPVDGGE
jgi:hypothetical protein